MSDSVTLRLNGLIEESIVDGPGLRYVLFTQGCPHHCHGCHNPDTHDPTAGYEKPVSEIIAQFEENPLLTGITFSGGEPFMQPRPLVTLAQTVHAANKNIVTYTGFVFEKLVLLAQEDEGIAALLEVSDILIDGPYKHELRSLELRFRGSTNQRILSREDRRALLASYASTL